MRTRPALFIAAIVILIYSAMARADTNDDQALAALKAALAKKDIGCPCGPFCPCGPNCDCGTHEKSEALPHAPARRNASFNKAWADGLREGDRVVVGLNCEAPVGEWKSVDATTDNGFRPGTAVMAFIFTNGMLHGGYRLPEDASQSEIRRMLEKAAEPIVMPTPAPQLIQQQPQTIYIPQPVRYGTPSFGFGSGAIRGGCAGGSCGG